MVHIPIKMHCDNQSVISIASNMMLHERTKHIKVDCHFIHDLVIKKHIVTPYVQFKDQLGDILTKPLARSLFSILCSKLGMFNFYVPI